MQRSVYLVTLLITFTLSDANRNVSLCEVTQLTAIQYSASPFRKPSYLVWRNVNIPETALMYSTTLHYTEG